MGEAKEVQQRRHRRVDQCAQVGDHLGDAPRKPAAIQRRVMRQLAQKPGQVSKRLVVQVHADPLALAFQILRKL